MSSSDFCCLSFKKGVLGLNFFRSSEILQDLINRSIPRVTMWGSVRSVRFHGSFCYRTKKYFKSQKSAKNELELLSSVRVAFHFSLWYTLVYQMFHKLGRLEWQNWKSDWAVLAPLHFLFNFYLERVTLMSYNNFLSPQKQNKPVP